MSFIGEHIYEVKTTNAEHTNAQNQGNQAKTATTRWQKNTAYLKCST